MSSSDIQLNLLINGAQAGSTLGEMQKEVRNLQKELKDLVPGSDAANKKMAEIAQAKAKVSSVTDEIKKMENELKGVGDQVGFFQGVWGKAAGFITGMAIYDTIKAAGRAMFEFGKDAVKEFEEAEVNAKKLRSSLNEVGEAGEVAFQKLIDQSDQLQSISIFSDDDIQIQQKALANYGLTGDQIETLIPKILDLASAQGTDLTTATDKVIKGLSGAGKGLKEVGFQSALTTTDMKANFDTISGFLNKFEGEMEVAANTGDGASKKIANSWGEFKEQIGGYIEPLKKSFIGFLSDILNNIQPIIEVFKKWAGVVGDVWNNFMGLLQGLGLVNKEASLGQTIMSGLTKIFSFLGEVSGFLWQRIGLVITAFKSLFAGAYATGFALRTIFTEIKETALNTLGGVADIIAGIFTLDLDRIKAGFQASKTVVSEFGADVSSAFQKAYNDKMAQFTYAPTPEEAQGSSAVGLGSGGQTGQVSQAEKDAAKKASDERKKLQKQNEQDEMESAKRAADLRIQLIENEYDREKATLQKNYEDAIAKKGASEEEKKLLLLKYHKDLADLEKKGEEDLTALRIEAIQDSTEREIAQLQADADKKIQEYVGTEEQIAEFTRLIREKVDQQRQELLSASASKNSEAQLNDSLLLIEKKYWDEYNKLGLDAMADNAQSVIDLELKKQDEIYNLQREAIIKQFELIKGSSTEERAQRNKLNQDLLKLDQDKQSREVANYRKTKDLKKAIGKEEMKVTGDVFQFAIDLLGQDEKARKKNAATIKAFSIGKVLVDLQQEIAGYMSHPGSVASLGTLGIVKSALAAARAGLAISSISKQQFAGGGNTGSGFYTDSTGHRVAGVVHDNEWVGPKWMTTHPQYMPVFNWLENQRLKGFADGGFTSTPSSTLYSSTFITNNSTDNSNVLLEILNQLKKPTRSYVVHDDIKAADDEINNIQDRSGL